MCVAYVGYMWPYRGPIGIFSVTFCVNMLDFEDEVQNINMLFYSCFYMAVFFLSRADKLCPSGFIN